MSKTNKPSKKRKSFLSKPYYEGGIQAMRAFIKENLKYPKTAIQGKVEGSVKIRYDIDYKGNVIKTKVIKSLGHGCNEEAERLVKLFKFNVERTRKMKVIFHRSIQINFKLPKEKPKKVGLPSKPPVSLQYNLTASTNKKNKVDEIREKSNGSSYSYTIQIN